MENLHKLVQWPESQLIMEHPDFKACHLIIDPEWMEVGSSAYFVPIDIFESVFGTKTSPSKYVATAAHIIDGKPTVVIAGKIYDTEEEAQKWAHILEEGTDNASASVFEILDGAILCTTA